MANEAHLDERYFIDGHVYNCPFCNRRHVTYYIYDDVKFDWSETKTCIAYFVRCGSCGNSSMHLSFGGLAITFVASNANGERLYRFKLPEDVESDHIDAHLFYSVPTSFFVLDRRVPEVLRDLLTEAEGCLKSNFLTGASACARKLVYELAIRENAKGDNYDDRIKSLKDVHPNVDPVFFDTLLTIQQVTSKKVHEQAYDGWQAKHLRVILASLKEVLHELYVVPALREDRRKAVIALKDELTGQPPAAAVPEGKSVAQTELARPVSKVEPSRRS